MFYGFIGLGNMASAIIGGMQSSGAFTSDTICGYDILEKCCETHRQNGVVIKSDICALVNDCDVVILAVKPQYLGEVFPLIADCNPTNKLIVSIAAGRTIEMLETGIGKTVPIIRVMPNINALVGAATSAYTANCNATSTHKQIVEKVFSTVGTITELPERLFSTFTAIGGSSPAFAYLYIDALAKAAVKGGMPRDLALKISASTVLGSAKMVLESGVHPAELCDRVCSPAGTTIDGVIELEAKGFEAAVHSAVEAVINKDKSM